MAAGPSPPTRAGEPAARRARHPFRTILKVLAWFIGSILLLLTIAFGLLQTELGRGWVKDLVLGVLNDNFKGSFECAHIGGFLPFHATVEGFVIKDPEGNLVLSVAKVDADFAPLGLLDQKVRLSDIHVTQPVVNIFDDKNRVMFVRAFEPKVPSPPTEAPPWEVELEGIVLDQGLVAGLVPGQDLALEDIRVGLTLSVGMNGPSWRDLAVTAVPRGGSELALALRGGPVSLRSSGSLDGDMLHVDHLDFDGGPHHASASAQLYLPDLSPGAALGAPAHTPSTVELTRLHVEIAALPPPVRDFLGPGFVDAAGRGTLSRGEANVHASLLTPLGFVGVQVGGTVLPRLGEYAGTLWTFDTVIPAGLRERLPPAIQAARVDLALDFHGRGNPLSPAGDFVAEGDVWQRAPADSGHLELAFQRLHEDLSAPHGEGELAPPASFSLRVVGDAFGLQPWLGTAGQPDLAGELHGLWAEGTLSLPSASQPLSLSAMFAFDGAVRGLLATGATSQPLALSRVAAQGTMTWDGRRAPVGHVELDADGVAAEAATAGSLATALDLELDGDGHLHARGTLRAVDLERLDLHAAAVDVPFDLTLVDGLPTGDIGGIIVSGRYGAHEIDRAETSLHVVREGSGLRVYGDVALNGLAVDHGAERVGDAELAIDLRLAATDPLDPMVVPSHGTVRGTLANVRAGPRSARQLDVDLRVDAYPAWAVRWRSPAPSAAAPSPRPRPPWRAPTRVNLTLRGADVQGSATIDAGDALVLVLPPAGGRRFNTVHVEARTLGGATGSR
ncbi:MAG: hypothetical protein U1F43_00700 [Myxococcota bacterium]